MRLPWPRGRAEEILQRATVLVLSLALAGLIGLAIVAFISSQDAAKQALDTRDQTAAAATRRIDQLRAEIILTRAELELARTQRAELIAKVDALVAQIDALGARPIAASTSSPQITNGRSTSPTTTTTAASPPQAPPPAPTNPQPQPEPEPEPEPGAAPFPCSVLSVPLVCQGAP